VSQLPADTNVEPAATPAPAAPGAKARPFWGTGRRKSAVARVRIVPGDGRILINSRELDAYFHEIHERNAVREPLTVANASGRWNVLVNVRGGGHSGQAGAVRLGVARALVKADSKVEPQLRDAGLLTRDSREVERKKYGRRKARRRFQFSKR
jgi:small subunit ribosomal protein S9